MSRLKSVDRMYLERLLEMKDGYVLSFSNATFGDFVRGSTGEDVYSESYSSNGESKANRLRAFWNIAPDRQVAALLGDLLTLMIDEGKLARDSHEAARVREIIASLGENPKSASVRGASDGSSGADKMRAFVSYSVERKRDGAAVKASMANLGYQCFLAHDDLRVSEEWKRRILDELRAADVFVALLSKEFMTSKWCGQELGFAVARPEVLVIPLILDGTTPYGFVEHLQGSRVTEANLDTVLQEVLFRERPTQMISAQIERVAKAGSFRFAEALISPLVPRFSQFSDVQVSGFVRAVVENPQARDAALSRDNYIPEFVRVNGSRIPAASAKALLEIMPTLEFPRFRG